MRNLPHENNHNLYHFKKIVMPINWIALLVSAIVPLLIGSIWYHPKVFGSAWMKLVGLSEADAQKMNMPMVFGLTLLLGFFLAVQLNFIVIHQMGVYSSTANEPNVADPSSEAGAMVAAFMDKYGNNFRTFRHGVLHGILTGLFLVLPVLAINAMFERKTWRYIWINAGYWVVTLALMGGIICAWK